MTQKIVINTESGSFHLSHIAEKKFLELKGKTPCFYYQQSILIEDPDNPGNKLVRSANIRTDQYSVLPFIFTVTSDLGENPETLKDFFRIDLIPRDDEDLVAVVEELGANSWGEFTTLKVVEIPNNVEWEIIEEYGDGEEYITEKRRTWR